MTVENIRKNILNEMESGRGSGQIYGHPVSLEPPFKRFSHVPEEQSFFKKLFSRENGNLTFNSEEPANGLAFIRIAPSKENRGALEKTLQFLVSLPSGNPIAFEIIGFEGEVHFQIAVRQTKADTLIAQLRSHFNGADIWAMEKDLLDEAVSPQASARVYRLKASHFFPLGVGGHGQLDAYTALLGGLGGLKDGQTGVYQVLFAPVASNWQDNMRQASRSQHDPSQSPFIDLPNLPKSVDEKLSKPLFTAGIRLLASNSAILDAMESFFRQFETAENGIEHITGKYPVQSILDRNTFVHGAILNAKELSYLVHLPLQELLNLSNVETSKAAFPVPDEFTGKGPALGYNVCRGVRKRVCHSESLPNRHMYIIGKSGYGKSNLILQMAIQRIEAGDGVAIIDPHGALVRQGILPRIPAGRINDVIYFNAGDFKYPMAINPLAHGGTKLEKEHIRTDLLNFFEDLFETGLGVTIQHTLNFGLITLLSRPDSTLLDLERLIIDKNWREDFLKGIKDERILAFWELEYPALEKRGIATAITNKLSPLVLPDSTIAPMLCSRENRIDFFEIMNTKKIFFANLSHGDIGRRNSLLLGKLLVSKLQIAAMMREGLGQCPDFYLYIDEFQHMVCPSMADILSGARKYGLHLCLANQMTGDIPDYILRHVFNASTMVFFATDSPGDQALIEKNLSKRFRAEDIGQLKKGEALVKMANSAFNMATERVPEPPSINYVDEIIASSRARYTAAKAEGAPCSTAKAVIHKPVAQKEKQPELSAQEKVFLECVCHNPSLSVTAIYRQLNLSAYMGDKTKSTLKEKGIIREITTHLGKGSRIAKFLILTPTGFKALGVSPEEGKGGALHRYWQTVISSYAEGKGYRVVIEEPITGGKETVDIGLEKDGFRIAVEVSITTRPEHEAGNSMKCLKAGYAKVIALFLEESKAAEFKTLVKPFTEEDGAKVSSGLVYDFGSFF